MLASDDTALEEQLAAARGAGDGAGRVADAARALATDASSLGPAFQLAVIDLALSAVKSGPKPASVELLQALEAVINADRQVTLHEFAVLALVRAQLTPRPGYQAPRYSSLGVVRAEVLTLLSLVAWAGAREGTEGAQDADAAFRAGAKELAMSDAQPIAREALDMDAAAKALDTLRGLAPRPKASLVQALFAAVTADGTIRVLEAELMRTVGAVLGCPLPPLLDHLDPATLTA